ncbi:MAG: LysM peptidoglycan-binding domain-containing C40 family peptidase [Campylobacterota bacterium]|nr:LysM peptidoglycan-binding domain-containing C40 family peptidase [Campylobacterota bacterium]
MKKIYVLFLLLCLNFTLLNASSKIIHHAIKNGETLYIIAHNNHTTIEEVRKMNNLKKGDILKIGRVLKVPTNTYFTKEAHKSKINNSKGLDLVKLARKKLGKRYVWGAQGQNSFDCSGFTYYVAKTNGIKLPRKAIAQSKVGKPISKKNLVKGDFVFFDTSKKRRGYVNHVGIYIGNNQFIHASSAGKKVIITSLNKPFYKQRFKGARRNGS